MGPVNSFTTSPTSVSPLQHRFQYDGSNRCVYSGEAAEGASEDDTKAWLLNKFFYDANGNCTKQIVGHNSWTNVEEATYA